MSSYNNAFTEFMSSPHITYAAFPLNLRLQFEEFFQADLSNVCIYEGFIAEEIGALALTAGTNILFEHGIYRPDLKCGQHLIAHELTHVIQQREGRIHSQGFAEFYLLEDFELEDEAERCADAFISGRKNPQNNSKRTSCLNYTTAVQPAKVNLRNKFFSEDKKHLKSIWEDYQKIQDILTRPNLFLPALRDLESRLSIAGNDLSEVLLKQEQDRKINIDGAPIYVGVLKDTDFDFKRGDSRAVKKALLAKDYVSPEHGDFTHRIHWSIIMYYCRGSPGASRLSITNEPRDLIIKSAWPAFKVEKSRWPNWRDLDHSPEALSDDGEYLWVALFDRICGPRDYDILQDWLTQPEIFTSLFLPEEFQLEHKSYPANKYGTVQSLNKDARKDASGKYHNFSKDFPKLSRNITQRYIKRTIELRMSNNKLNEAEAAYLQKKKEKEDYELAKYPAPKIESSPPNQKVLFRVAPPRNTAILRNSDQILLRDADPVEERFFSEIALIESGLALNALRELENATIPTLLRKAINDATIQYIYWMDNEKGFGLFKHGNSGKTRALSVNRESSNINKDPFQVLSDFANNRIKDETGGNIRGSINTNRHSYISFILHNIKLYTELADTFSDDNDELSTMIQTDFFRDDQATRNLKSIYLNKFRNNNEASAMA